MFVYCRAVDLHNGGNTCISFRSPTGRECTAGCVSVGLLSRVNDNFGRCYNNVRETKTPLIPRPIPQVYVTSCVYCVPFFFFVRKTVKIWIFFVAFESPKKLRFHFSVTFFSRRPGGTRTFFSFIRTGTPDFFPRNLIRATFLRVLTIIRARLLNVLQISKKCPFEKMCFFPAKKFKKMFLKYFYKSRSGTVSGHPVGRNSIMLISQCKSDNK